MANYTVFDQDAGKTREGTARQILEQIRKEFGEENDEIRSMDVDEYARAVIEDADYFLPNDLLKALKNQQYNSEHDRALTYLAQMPTSGIRILALSGANGR